MSGGLRFGVPAHDITRVFAEQHAEVSCSISIVLGALGGARYPKDLQDAALKEFCCFMIAQVWGNGKLDLLSASDAMIEIRSALQAQLPQGEDYVL